MHPNPEVLVALGKAAPKLADKDALPVGTYPIDCVLTLHLTGELQKLADTLYTPTTSIPLLDSVALFISRMGPVRRGEVLALWEQCVCDALLGKGEVEDGIRGDLEAMHEKIRDSLDALPKKTRAGEVRGKVEARIIDWPAVDAIAIDGAARECRGGCCDQEEQTSVPPVQDKSKARRRRAA